MPYISKETKEVIGEKSLIEYDAGELTYWFYLIALVTLPETPRYRDYHNILALFKEAENLYNDFRRDTDVISKEENPFFSETLYNIRSKYFVLAALEAAKLEFYRRQVAPYEDKKIESNGDVFRGEFEKYIRRK